VFVENELHLVDPLQSFALEDLFVDHVHEDLRTRRPGVADLLQPPVAAQRPA
jgi:hypothetical protein